MGSLGRGFEELNVKIIRKLRSLFGRNNNTLGEMWLVIIYGASLVREGIWWEAV